MPYSIDLTSVRGDQLLLAIPLMRPTTPPTPLTQMEAQAIKDTWPTILMQVKSKDVDDAPLLSLSSADAELSVEVAYPQANGTSAPVLLIQASAAKCSAVISKAAYDIEFSGPGVGPYTWVGGKFTLTQDTTRAAQ